MIAMLVKSVTLPRDTLKTFQASRIVILRPPSKPCVCRDHMEHMPRRDPEVSAARTHTWKHRGVVSLKLDSDKIDE